MLKPASPVSPPHSRTAAVTMDRGGKVTICNKRSIILYYYIIFMWQQLLSEAAQPGAGLLPTDGYKTHYIHRYKNHCRYVVP